jgi:hypothetical protein
MFISSFLEGIVGRDILNNWQNPLIGSLAMTE